MSEYQTPVEILEAILDLPGGEREVFNQLQEERIIVDGDFSSLDGPWRQKLDQALKVREENKSGEVEEEALCKFVDLEKNLGRFNPIPRESILLGLSLLSGLEFKIWMAMLQLCWWPGRGSSEPMNPGELLKKHNKRRVSFKLIAELTGINYQNLRRRHLPSLCKKGFIERKETSKKHGKSNLYRYKVRMPIGVK